MAKDNTFYFPHDYNARNDIKIKKLFANHGWIGYGLFWAIIEELYNNANALPTDYESIAFDLRSEVTLIKSIINDFDLFQIKDDFFGSLSIQRRLEDRNNKTTKARESAFKRWNKCESNANALPTQSDSNAIKESKVKEIINYNPMGFEEPKKADNDNDNEKDFIDKKNISLNTEEKDVGTKVLVVDEKFLEYVKNNFPTVAKLQMPNSEQVAKLKATYKFSSIEKTLKAMENKKALLKTYKSCILTLTNWLDRDDDSKIISPLQETETERKIREFKARGF
jgi:hypothetical protein